MDCSLLGDGSDTKGCNDSKPKSATPSTQQAKKSVSPCDDVWCAVTRPSGIQDSTWNTYLTMYNLLEGTSFLLDDGRMTDQFLLAIIIRVEFNGLGSHTRIYEAALEALSNQYSGYGCSGGCSSLQQQLGWLNGMEGWYGKNGKEISVADCPRCLGDATRVIKGVNDNDGYTAFWWGNPKPISAMSEYISVDPTGRSTPSWGDDTLGGAFIVQVPIGGGNYGNFLVVTWAQNKACGDYPEPVTCMGFVKP